MEGREEWMDGVKAVFNYFAERTPGSYIEKLLGSASKACLHHVYIMFPPL